MLADKDLTMLRRSTSSQDASLAALPGGQHSPGLDMHTSQDSNTFTAATESLDNHSGRYGRNATA